MDTANARIASPRADRGRRVLRACVAAGAAAWCAVCLTGCAAAVAVPLFSIASAGASTADVGYATWKNGRLRYVDDAGLAEVTAASRAALEGLDLRAGEALDITHKGEVRKRIIEAFADGDELVTVRLERLTDRMTAVTIDAGFLGDREAARLIADHIRGRLRSVGDAGVGVDSWRSGVAPGDRGADTVG